MWRKQTDLKYPTILNIKKLQYCITSEHCKIREEIEYK